ncbi:phage tail protein [Fusobacterium polymorphum]|uniref:phage tail-collar fiber domain-containing protein n=2 Tax=Fusobacterium nucleatum subsp. polymorphum TaxID=76857 RepID=UPI00206BE698|nr:MAG TPA: tail-collar fiber protein [Caudoviricetes sp.]
MAFRGLTKKGADYLATRLANELAVEFLKVEIGDGAVVSGQNPKNQTSLISYKKDVRILKKEQENNAINLTIQITNDDITQGFYLKEIGIYVNDSSSNGCLYWYCNEDNAQYIPAKTDSVLAFEIDIRMEVTNSDATIINWSGKNTWINKEYLEENYTQNGGYKGTALEIDDRVVSALGKEDGKFPLNEAIQGNVYYFPANKKFYICKETQNRRISVPDVKFEELSIWENRKRLENFSKLEGERLYVPNATFIKVYKIAGMVTLIVDSGTAFFNKANTPIFNIPEKYRPNETLYFSASYRNNTKSNTFFLYANGNLIKSEADDNLGAYYFTISYPAKN